MPAAPKTKGQPDKLKQKSLMGWFGKGSDAPPTGASAAKPKPKPATLSATPSTSTRSVGSSDSPETPQGKRASASVAVTSASYTRSSDGGSSVKDTPPTSDPIDVDMMTEDGEDDEPAVSVRASRAVKRKILLEDSDEEDENAAAQTKKKTPAPVRPKKARMSVPLSDDEDEEVEEAPSKLSQRISRFKKSPVKTKGKASSQASDDDDFIVPSDSSLSPAPSRSSSRASQRSSAVSDEDEGDEEVEEPKAKSKAKPKGRRPYGFGGRPVLKKADAPEGGSSSQFLTAAESRAMAQKSEKKSAENPFEFLQDVRDKDGVRPGEPGYDPRTLFIPKRAWDTFTPFEKQFWEIKQNHFDTVLFFQKGKFLELYEDDARIGHQQFDLKLTQRVKMSMVGVPEMSFNAWAAKFLAKGYKVGRVGQAETALGAEMRLAADKGKGKISEDKNRDKIVRRELSKVYTNGTLVDPELLADDQAGHCVAVRENDSNGGDRSQFGFCVLDCSTSEFNLSAFEDDVCRTRLETLMRQLRPKEIIFTKGNLSVSTTRLLKSVLPGSCLWTSLRDSEGFGFKQTLEELNEMYPADENDANTMEEDSVVSPAVPAAIKEVLASHEAVEALGSMMWYLRQLNIDKEIMGMKNFNIYDPMKRGEGLVLDGQTLAHIEVLMNSDGTDDGSLLKLLGRCATPFGKRLFRIWLCMPLRQVADINARLDAVQDLMNNPSFEQEFADLTKGLPDLERVVSRIHAKNCKIKDFVKVLDAFKKLSKGLSAMTETAESFDSKMVPGLLRSAPDLLRHIKNVESMYQKPDKDSDALYPVEGKDKPYDDIMQEIEELEEDLEKSLKKLEKEVGTSLSYYHSGQGAKEVYLVQTKSAFKGVPKTWANGGSTKALKRWIVPSLSATIRQLKEARETRSQVIKSFKMHVFEEFDADRSVWLRAIRVLAELDCLFSLAKSSSALGEPTCRPELIEGDAAFIDFEELRHPALCVSSSLKGDFIPNDVKLGGDIGRIALLTGPNMGGKSTAMRMTAAGVIMAQLGMMVPAKSARLCPVDSILTRMGAYDNMFTNASTFKVEMDESCKILREATPKSLVILDELGRGTSTYDGMAIAGAVLHELATRTLALSFFATHYGSLTDDFAYHPAIRNMHMSTMLDDEKRELVFLYKLVGGVAESSFGTHVAKLAGVPDPVVARAEKVSSDFAQQFKAKIAGRKAIRVPLAAQADFAYLYAVATGRRMMPDNDVRRREVLGGIKEAVRRCLVE